MIDVRLVEYLLGIPAIPWCVNKEILRVAMAGRLPKAVLNRPKSPLADNPTCSPFLQRGGGSGGSLDPVPLSDGGDA